MNYYGFQYTAGRRTTCGESNPSTGRMSIAGDLKVFQTPTERDRWVESSPVGVHRAALNSQEARAHCAGMSIEDYQGYLESLREDLELEEQKVAGAFDDLEPFGTGAYREEDSYPEEEEYRYPYATDEK